VHDWVLEAGKAGQMLHSNWKADAEGAKSKPATVILSPQSALNDGRLKRRQCGSSVKV
jgi:hypothetical protein